MATEFSSSAPLSPLHKAVLSTVLYSDLFDHPLTIGELHRYLVTSCPDRATLEQAVEALDGVFLSTDRNFVFMRGREAAIELRHRRQGLAAKRWPPARRFARWLGWVPFLRMVAVCGSQAVDNGDDDGDVDLFLITEPRRLWLVQSLTMILRRAGHLIGIEVCPNYLLTTGSLRIEGHSLYAAREAAQAVPLWGRDAYAEFLDVNGWIEGFLPQHAANDRHLPEPRPRQWLTSLLERLLGGSIGDLADRLIHSILLRYYRLRLRHHGWQRQDIENAYRRDRQVVVTGGYAKAVARRYVERGLSAFDGALSADELRHAFFGAADSDIEKQIDRESPDPLYAGLMAARYGDGS